MVGCYYELTSYLTCIEGDTIISGTTSSILNISCIVIVRMTISNAKHPRTNIVRGAIMCLSLLI
jgi:hypothetical protein